MQGNKKASGLNNVAIFFSSKHFVYPVLSSSQIDSLISEYIVFCILDNTQSLSLYSLHDQFIGSWSIKSLSGFHWILQINQKQFLL